MDSRVARRVGAAKLEFRILGAFEVGDGPRSIAVRGAKLRALLAVLALSPNQPVSVDRLADALWGDGGAVSIASLHTYISKLRKALGPDAIETRPPGYRLAIHREQVDAVCFERLATAGKDLTATDPRRAWELLDEALSLWRGPALADFAFEPFAQAEIARLEEARLTAIEDHVDAALALGRHAEVVARLRLLVDEHPLRERLWGQLMVSLYRSGRQAEALRAYSALRQHLGEELGIEPSPALRHLEDAMLRQVASLDWAGVRPADRDAVTTRASVPPDARLPLMGRADELATLLGPPRGAFAVTAAPGMGKTRLLAEVAQRAAGPVLSVRARPSERNEPWSLARAMISDALTLAPTAASALPARVRAVLADIAPDAATGFGEDYGTVSGTVDAESRRALAMEGAVRLVAAAAGNGGLLLVDDVQWADSTSLRLLTRVRTRLPDIKLVVAHRREDAKEDASTAVFLSELAATGGPVTELTLSPLELGEISALFSDDEMASVVAEESDGSPLAITDLVSELARRGAIGPDPCGVRWSSRHPDAASIAREVAHAGHQRNLGRLVMNQPADRRQLLQLLALRGGETPARVLAAATQGAQAAVVDALSALAAAKLVNLGDHGWSTHGRAVDEAVLEQCDRVIRGRLHQLLAQALDAEGGDRGEIGRHLMAAGDRPAAAVAFAEAARQRLAEHAAEEVLALAESGLRLDPMPMRRTELLGLRADARQLLGDRNGARRDLRRVADLLPRGPARARVLVKLALLSTSDDPAAAVDLIEVALSEASGNDTARADALAAGAVVDVNLNRLARADERSTAAAALFQEAGDAHGLAHVLDAQAMGALYRGHLRDAAERLERAASFYRDAGNLTRAGMPRVLSAWALTLGGRADEGLRRADEALELERTLGQVEGEAWCEWARCAALSTLGRIDEAVSAGEHSLAVHQRTGNREGAVMALCALGGAYMWTGEHARAAQLYGEAAERAGGLCQWHYVGGLRASLAMAQGDFSAADRHARACLSGGPRLAQFEGSLVIAELALAQGHPLARDAASSLLEETDADGYVVSEARVRLEGALSGATAHSMVA